jgi:mRNA interferase MazF
VYWVQFDPALGGEIQKTRPAVIVSNDQANKYLNRVQVVPITSQADKLYPSEAPIIVNGRRCKAAADQLRTVAKERLREKIAELTSEELRRVEHAIRIQLALA